MNNPRLRLLACATALLFLPSMAAAEIRVVASVKPIHSLVSAVMNGIGAPGLIVEGAASPHTYSLKPSNASALQGADVVFWVGHGLEAFLEKPLEALAGKAKVVALEDAPGLEKLAFREGGAFDAHDHADDEGGKPAEEHDEEDHGGTDMHLWLDPMNAKAMATEIEQTLVAADPANAERYRANGQALRQEIDALDKEIARMVAPVADRPSVVFHDAYQYFESRYKVRIVGSITVSPETMPGAERIAEIHAKVQELKAACVFAEPQFEPKLIAVVTEGTDAKSGTLDPAGGALEAGPALYPELMRNLARSFVDCLAK
ncbi:MAG: zinc ABC transporter substrate-binding protein ZnuA [Rhizobium sp.]